ncbi:amino acid adenylation domain-containing protein [Dickeya dianthicola]|uniref:amino acid adenylation domain-containing protein n=1 Tax=Dickeya dianthicola TaxID=204039 RepID=UPI001F6159F3|nr:amino acid adenylation domain-containing protein [Dickeya dianthicola]MCI4188444.1 amino acid adenylation domain-containing protein [Dickeya dianthicola]
MMPLNMPGTKDGLELFSTQLPSGNPQTQHLYCSCPFFSVPQLIAVLKTHSNNIDVWEERCSFSSCSSSARELRKRQLSLSIHDASLRQIRATIIVYYDGVVDLFLAASRNFFNRTALEQVLEKCQSNTGNHSRKSIDYCVGEVLSSGDIIPDIISRQFGKEGNVSVKSLLTALALFLPKFTGLNPQIAVHTDTHNEKNDSLLSAESVLDESIKTAISTTDVGVFISKSIGSSVGSIKQYRSYTTRPYPLTLELEISDEQVLSVRLNIDVTRFSFDWANHFADCLIHIAKQVDSQSYNSEQFEWVPKKELTKVVRAGCGRKPEPFRSQRIEEIISNYAEQYPHAVALSFEDQVITYNQLVEEATRIASSLIKLGVKVQDRVGVCMGRSPKLISMMLGILKAGGTYVPVDPDSPADRIAYIVDDAMLSFMIAEEMHAIHDVFENSISLKFIEKMIDDDAAQLLLPECVKPEHAAYIIYTSGSTGRPKGVVVPHTNVQSLVQGTVNDFAIGKNDIWTFFHSVAFDFSIWEIWGCLLTGGHLVIVPYWVSRTPDVFYQLIRKEGVTILSQTPSAFYQLIEQALVEVQKLESLRLIILGGEALDSVALLPWFDRYPESTCRVVNMFGITETTVHVTAKTMLRQDALSRSRSAGRAIHGWKLYVLDENKQLLPFGASGEIYVGGDGVATQYLNKPELTLERFSVDLFSTGRMYRSGDRGYLCDNGELIYEGRLDSQVKLRGFRIELGEIRQTLLGLNGVTSVAVVLYSPQERSSASSRLDCYLILNNITVSDVKQYAAKLLPEYMLPNTYTIVDALPMTTNGKLDVASLPYPDLSAKHVKDSGADFITHQYGQEETDIATQLQIIWSEIFGIDVGLTDNFFDLGGNSLLAVRIVTKARQLKINSLSVRDIYIHQSIDEFVTSLKEYQQEQ